MRVARHKIRFIFNWIVTFMCLQFRMLSCRPSDSSVKLAVASEERKYTQFLTITDFQRDEGIIKNQLHALLDTL